MADQSPPFNARGVSDGDVVCATCGSYEMDHLTGRGPQALSRTGVFGATPALAPPQTLPLQPSFSQTHNASSNLPGNATFNTSKAMQLATGNQHLPRSASVPRHSRGQAARVNPHPSANQVALFAEEQPINENFMLID